MWGIYKEFFVKIYKIKVNRYQFHHHGLLSDNFLKILMVFAFLPKNVHFILKKCKFVFVSQ